MNQRFLYNIFRENELQQEEYEKEQEDLYYRVIEYINKIPKKELVEDVVEYGPDWLYTNFIRKHDIE